MRVITIALKARYQMNMSVHSGLSRYFPHVHADVVAVRRELSVDQILCAIQQHQDCLLLFKGQAEEIRDMAERDDQDMSWCRRKIVGFDISQTILQEHGI